MTNQTVGLILSGGGARAAYQVGVLRGIASRAGVLEPNGARVLSYLLFERRYCRHLMHLGYMDAMRQRERILGFLGCESPLRRHSGGRHPQERFTACASVLRVTAAGP